MHITHIIVLTPILIYMLKYKRVNEKETNEREEVSWIIASSPFGFCFLPLWSPASMLFYLPLPSAWHTTHSAYRVVVQVVHETAGQRSTQVTTSYVRDGCAGLQAVVQLRRNDAQAPVVARVVVHDELAHHRDSGRQHQEKHGRAATTSNLTLNKHNWLHLTMRLRN